MSLSAPPPQHNFIAILLSSCFVLLMAEIPFLFTTGWTISDAIFAITLNLLLSFVLWYWWLFGSKRPIRSVLIFQLSLLLIVHPFIIGVHHWDLVSGSGDILALSCWIEFINPNFALLVLLTSTLGAYAIARNRSDQQSLRSYSTIEWTLLTIDLKNRTFGSMKNLPFIHWLYWPLCLIGGAYLFWFINEFADQPGLVSNVKIIGIVQMITMILAYRVGLFLGEGFRLIQIEKMTPGTRFHLENFDEFMKWRHDYVKYHLPAPIRKLNLRLFNQHVEAYERLQKEVKSSRT